MKPASFTYHRAYEVQEVIELLTQLGPEAKILAGGQSLVALMNFRLARPTALVDVNGVAGLDYLDLHAGVLRVGALTRHRAVELAARQLPGYGVLAATARWIGHLPIRTRGTFGGSIAHADPAAEWCVIATLLEADMIIQGPTGRRTVPARDFFHGFLTTSLEPDELLVEVVFGQDAPHAALTEYARRSGDFALVTASASLQLDQDRCTSATVVLGGVDSIPVRLPAVEAVLAGQQIGAALFAEAADVAAREISPASDLHASERYRRALTRTLLSRALAEASHVAA